jgi:hypothetical protein
MDPQGCSLADRIIGAQTRNIHPEMANAIHESQIVLDDNPGALPPEVGGAIPIALKAEILIPSIVILNISLRAPFLSRNLQSPRLTWLA